MARTILGALGLTVLSFLLSYSPTFAAENGTIRGHVRDAVSGDPLPGATVLLAGTSLGGSTNLNGEFNIRDVPPGTYTLQTSYIGYKAKDELVSVSSGGKVEVDLKLEAVGVQGKEVVVTAQASGQNQAINQQLSSNQIVSVVSAARIQELPDANAAESVGRLPGVSVLRTGGEGDEVVIRGLAPKYNEITINGVQMTSSNPLTPNSVSDRAVDLSMISSDMLEAIDVKKTVTPDMDANVIGGVVNFELREADVVRPGIPRFGLTLQGGYNSLPNAYNKLNNYKYVASAENRWMNEQLGVFAEIDVERRNLTSNELGASYSPYAVSTTKYLTQSLNLNNIPRDRRRYNGALVIDYRMPGGSLKFSNFGSSGMTDVANRGQTFNVLTNTLGYSLAYSRSLLAVLVNSLDLKYQLPILRADLKLAHSYNETKAPDNWTVSFQQASAGLSNFAAATDLNPQAIPKAATYDSSRTYLNNIVTSNSFTRSRALTASLDLEKDVNVSSLITSVIKFGGEYRHVTRSNSYNQSTGQGLGLTSARFVDSLITSHFPATHQYVNTTSIPAMPFLDANYSYGKFLGGNYFMTYPLNAGMLGDMANFVEANTELIRQNNDAISFFHDLFNSTTYNYTGSENQSAGYVMATVNIGTQLTLIPGVRYQNLQTEYTAPRGLQSTASATGGGAYFHYDTTVTVNHGYWLPDVALRYKPFPWADVRLSYTNTLAYPDFSAIIPRIDVSTGNSIAFNNYNLVPSRSANYDAYLSLYDNTIGLFGAGVFMKQIDDLIYPWTFFVSNADALPYYPPGISTSPPRGVYNVTTYLNDKYRVTDWGIELDWQTHFWYLPSPFSGLILNVNYTHVFSKARYPYVATVVSGRTITYVDSSYTTRLLYQPDNIANVSLGYDYRGFSIRLSMLYQDNIFSGPNFWPQLRAQTAAYTRWDISAKQDLPWPGIQLYADLTNLNSENDVQVIQAATGVPQSEQSYGMTALLGLRLKF